MKSLSDWLNNVSDMTQVSLLLNILNEGNSNTVYGFGARTSVFDLQHLFVVLCNEATC